MVVWYVDDLKISHKDSAVVDKVIASLSDKYGKVGEMTVKRGKIHEYLGMILDFSEESKFIVNIEEYIDEILIGLPEDMNGVATTRTQAKQWKSRAVPPCHRTKSILGTMWQTQPTDCHVIPDQAGRRGQNR